MVHVLKTIDFDKRYQRGVGQYLYDEHGEKYLDVLSGWGAFAIGRNHPTGAYDSATDRFSAALDQIKEMTGRIDNDRARRLMRRVGNSYANAGSASRDAGAVAQPVTLINSKLTTPDAIAPAGHSRTPPVRSAYPPGAARRGAAPKPKAATNPW